MAKDLTGTVTWPAGITVPEGGDPRRASTVELPFGQLANRTSYLLDRTDGSGVHRIRRATDIASAQALTGLSVGDVVLIGGNGTFYGLYMFDTVSPDPYEYHSPYALQVTTGGWLYCSGNAFLCGYNDPGETGYENTYRRIIQTDQVGKLAFPQILTNRTIFRGSVSGGHTYPDGGSDNNWEYSAHSSPVTTYTILDSGVYGEKMSVTLPVLYAGDIITVWAHGGASKNSGQSGTSVVINGCLYDKTDSQQYILSGMSCVFNLPGSTASTHSEQVFRWSMSGSWTSPTTWTSTEMQLRFKCNNDMKFLRGVSFVVDIVRP